MADKSESKSGSREKTSPKKRGENPAKKKIESPSKVNAAANTSPKKESVVGDAELESSKAVIEKPLVEEKVNVDDEELTVVEEAEGAVGGSWTGWFSSTINQAKERSNEMLQYLKQDLSEFTETVSEAGRDLKDKLKLEENAKVAVNVVGEKMNVVLEQMSNIFGVGPDDDDETVIVGNSGPMMVDRIQAKIYSLALEETVFLNDPEDMEAYEKWLAHFDLEVKSEEIADLLTANPHLQLHYSQLVPDKVSHLVFWHRFYYRVQLIFDAEARQQAKEKQEKKQSSKNSNQESRSGNGSPVDESGASGDQSMVEISEEDQKRLLAEYEEELKKGEEAGKHSRRSSGTQLSSSSSGSFAFVTHDPDTNEVKVE